jgi:hypothetical protein
VDSSHKRCGGASRGSPCRENAISGSLAGKNLIDMDAVHDITRGRKYAVRAFAVLR